MCNLNCFGAEVEESDSLPLVVVVVVVVVTGSWPSRATFRLLRPLSTSREVAHVWASSRGIRMVERQARAKRVKCRTLCESPCQQCSSLRETDEEGGEDSTQRHTRQSDSHPATSSRCSSAARTPTAPCAHSLASPCPCRKCG